MNATLCPSYKFQFSFEDLLNKLSFNRTQSGPNFASFVKADETLKFIWLGQSTLIMNVDGHLILVDPVLRTGTVSLSKLPPIETILITSDQVTHLDEKTIRYFQDKKTRFITPTGVGAHLRDWGIEGYRISELEWHESLTANGISFRATPAQSESGRGLFDLHSPKSASWIIQGQTDKIFYSGDSSYGPHFDQIGREYGPFDFGFIQNEQPDETIQAHADLNAHTLIPVTSAVPLIKTFTIAKSWDIPIIIPRVGEIVEWNNYPSSL